MDDGDVLALAGAGGFASTNATSTSCQGRGPQHHILVIQQASSRCGRGQRLLLAAGRARSRRPDRVERFNALPPASLGTGRTDVVSYALPSEHLETLLDRVPGARQFVSAYTPSRWTIRPLTNGIS